MNLIFGLASFLFGFPNIVFASVNKRFNRYSDKLVSEVFREQTTESAIHCNALCSEVEICLSVSYRPSTRECQLSSTCHVALNQTESGWVSFIKTDDCPCRGVYNESFGIIQSPNYPSNYDANVECVWVISAPANNHVVLTCSDMEIEPQNLCESDFIQVRDGNNEAAPLLAVLCGSSAPQVLKTCNAGSMYIKLQTDHVNNYRGFNFAWRFQSSIGLCGCNYYNVQSGTIMSPNYPDNYFANADCMWVITTFKGPITFTFTDFKTHSNHDFVEVLKGTSGSSASLATFSGGTIPGKLRTTGTVLSVRFYTDTGINFQGFKADWQAVRMQVL